MCQAREYVLYLTGNLKHHVKGDVSKLARRPAHSQRAERQGGSEIGLDGNSRIQRKHENQQT